jgi:hypothetical protein
MPCKFNETCRHRIANASVALQPGTILRSKIETARDELPTAEASLEMLRSPALRSDMALLLRRASADCTGVVRLG